MYAIRVYLKDSQLVISVVAVYGIQLQIPYRIKVVK